MIKGSILKEMSTFQTIDKVEVCFIPLQKGKGQGQVRSNGRGVWLDVSEKL